MPQRRARLLDMSSPRVREAVQLTAKEARGFYWITVEKYHPVRTLKQNRYYWSVCLDYLADFLTEGTGEPWDDDMAHEFSKALWLQPVIRVLPNGSEYRAVRSTKSLTTKDFAQMVDSLILFLAENGVEVPPPKRFEK